jgi:hypothetical protein
MTATLIGDVTVAILLIVAIGYAAVLNRRLAVLREDRAKLEELIQGLNVASVSAQTGIAGLRKVTEEVGKDLEKELAASRSLRDDLHYLIERGGAAGTGDDRDIGYSRSNDLFDDHLNRRPVDHRQHLLWNDARRRQHPGAEAGREDNGLANLHPIPAIFSARGGATRALPGRICMRCKGSLRGAP